MCRSPLMLTAFLLPALLLAATANDAPIAKQGCPANCGNVTVPYPFGIGKNCFRKGFEIVCRNNNTTPVLPTPTHDQVIEVLSLSVMPLPEARVRLPVAWRCYDANGSITGEFDGRVDFNKVGVYRISSAHNELIVLGCNTLIYTGSGSGGRYGNTFYSGCVTYCENSRSAQDGSCVGVGCCHVDMPTGLTDNVMTFSDWNRTGLDFCPCDYGFMVEKEYYKFKATDLRMDVNQTRMPLRLDWAIRDGDVHSTTSMSCAEAAKKPTEYTCISDHSVCFNSTNGPGYACNCSEGYEGNPYLKQGCININECERPKEYPCYGKCRDTVGSYNCNCPSGYESKDARIYPCNPKFSFAAKLALGICVSVFLLVVSLLVALIMLQKRKLAKLFEKNGGKILQNVKGLIIFSKKELNKITKNNSEFIGNGGFGKVYKGTLLDNTIVAVKASIKVDEDTKQEFIEEMKIHTNMIHKNIIKLIGCCLEVDVPMLVYEFAANGSLREILHGRRTKKLPLDLRLDIAIGCAEGLRYMHSSTIQPIRHGDIKPDNILLDDKLTPKISDFGLSKLLNEESFARNVAGSLGYTDPVFIKTGFLTQKSDVYSFGVILLELITGKKNIYNRNHSLIIDICKVYEKEKCRRLMFDHEIAIGEDIFILEEIGQLAMECLNEDIEERPEMMEVAERLFMLRRDMKLGKTYNIDHHHSGDTTMYSSPENTSIRVTTNATS